MESEFNCLLEKEETRWRQRSRISWLREGDQNTRFFHVPASQRRGRNTIKGITDLNGSWVTNQQGIFGIFLDFFNTLFSSDGTEIMSGLSFGLRDRVIDQINTTLC